MVKCRTTLLTRVGILLISACLPALFLCTSAKAEDTVSARIELLLGSENLSLDGVDILTRDVLAEAYRSHGFEPFWTSSEQGEELIDLIALSADHGLLPADYNHEILQEMIRQWSSMPTPDQAAKLDLMLSESLLRYGYHRRFGKVEGSTLDPNINFRRELFHQQAPPETIKQALNSDSLTGFIENAAPSGTFYRLLQVKLDQYRGMAAAGGWALVPEGPTLRPGEEDARVVFIRNRLAVSGDLPGGADLSSALFDEDVADAVRAFQSRHALDDDSIVGKQSIAAMNVPVETRIDQIRLTLERLRWIRQEITGRLVLVNIAGFRVFYLEDNQIAWVTRAMVGKNYRQTPVFRGDIAYMEFNPTWTIPPTILRNDTLPAIKKDPGYLASKNIRVIDRNGQFVDPAGVDWNQYTRGVPYTLRQDPGPNNALGTVKFIFPNEHFVFLHDTPHVELFALKGRAFSSGCIRVENPLKLAELLLDDPDRYNQETLAGIVASRNKQRIKPPDTVPVVITYLTASLEPDGRTRFLQDIYQRDQRVLDALNGPVIIDLP